MHGGAREAAARNGAHEVILTRPIRQFSEGAALGYVIGSSIARQDKAEAPEIFGMKVVPYVDPETGTILVRGTFPNPYRLPDRLPVLTPGLFVRVRVRMGPPHPLVERIMQKEIRKQGRNH